MNSVLLSSVVLIAAVSSAHCRGLEDYDGGTTSTEDYWTTTPTEDPWTTTSPPDTTSTPDPWNGRYCPPPPATEHTGLFPHVTPVVSTSCGEYFDCHSGGIFYKPFETLSPNERCIWTVAVPSAKGYDVTIQHYGYEPTAHNEGEVGLIISDFGHSRPPTHLIPTTTDTISIPNTSMLLLTFFTGSSPPGNQSGFILQFRAQMEGNLTKPVSTSSKHRLVGADQYYLGLAAFVASELSSYVFLPKDNLYREGKENRATYVYLANLSCTYEQLKVYFFNTTCVGPNKWQYQGRLCGTTPSYELIKSAEPILIVFESGTRTGSTSFMFTYSASC